jgi:hypothetical protein
MLVSRKLAHVKLGGSRLRRAAAMLRRDGRKSVADPFERRPDPEAREIVGAN